MILNSAFTQLSKSYTFPELVKDAELIAIGKTKLLNGKCFFIISKNIKGPKRTKLSIKEAHIGLVGPIIFTDNQEVILFLGRITDDDQGILLGEYELGKWPKTSLSGYPDFISSAPVKEVEEATKKILRLDTCNNVKDKLKLCEMYFASNNDFLVYIVLQYIQLNSNLNLLIDGVTKDVVKLASSSKSHYIQFNALRLLDRYVPEISLPILIDQLSNENTDIRRISVTTTNTVLARLKSSKRIPPEDIISIDKMIRHQKDLKIWWAQKETD